MNTALPAGTPVRYWPGFRDGASKLSRIRSGDVVTLGGTQCQYIMGAGAISCGHIEELHLSGSTISVATAAEALEVCGWEGVEDVVITDNAERLKMQKMLRGFRQ
jgi:hypothetical protein